MGTLTRSVLALADLVANKGAYNKAGDTPWRRAP
jgi:hypothetical protein